MYTCTHAHITPRAHTQFQICRATQKAVHLAGLIYDHPLFLLAPFLGSSLLNTQCSNLEGKMVLE